MYEITYEDGTVEYTDTDPYEELDRKRMGHHIVKSDGMLDRYCVTIDRVWWYYVPWSDLLSPFMRDQEARKERIEQIRARFRFDKA